MTDSGTLSTYQAEAEQYREQNADRSVIEDLVNRFLKKVEDTTGDSTACVLDVGCGPGWESASFANRGYETVGIDLTPAFLKMAREESPDTSFARMDMRQLGLQRNTFDGVWACASFLHVPRRNAPSALAEFHRVVKERGIVHLSVKRGNGEESSSVYGDNDERLFTLYQASELEAMLVSAEFDIDAVTTDEDGDWLQVDVRA